MSEPIKYCEAVRHIMSISSQAVTNVGQVWARDDDAGGKWIKTPLTLDMLRC